MPRAAYGGTGSTGSPSGGGYVDDWWNRPVRSAGGQSISPVDGTTTGRFNIDVTSPAGFAGSLEKGQQQSDDFVAGIGEALFGQKTGLINSIPGIGSGIGDIVRGVSSLPLVGIPAALPGHVFGAGKNILSRIPLGWLPGGVDQTFDALPETPEKQLVRDAANADVLSGGNLKYDYTVKILEERSDAQSQADFRTLLDPKIQAGIAGSVGGLLGQVLALVGTPQRVVERQVAGAGVRPSGQDRLDEVISLASSDPSQLTPVEAQVAQMVGSGQWDEARALDYLSSHNAGLAHDPLVQFAGSFATDPAVGASLASGLISRSARRAGEAIEAGQEASRFGQAALNAQQSALGPLLKNTRTVIDPLSLIGGQRAKKAITPQVVDTLSQRTVGALIDTTWGRGNAVAVRDAADRFGMPDLVSRVFNDLSTAVQNLIVREHVGSQVGDNAVASGASAFPPQALRAVLSQEQIDRIAGDQTKYGLGEMMARGARIKATNVDIDDLAQRMAISYGRTADEYKPLLESFGNGDSLSILHAATFSSAENGLNTVVGTLTQVKNQLPVARMVLGNPRNLHMAPATALRDALEAAPTKDAGKLLAKALEDFDDLASIVKYDPEDITGSVKRAVANLTKLLSEENFPRIATAKEIAAYPALKAWADTHKPWQIAFRPKDENLWRAVYDTEGKLAFVNMWVGHAPGDAKSLYRPGFNLPRNLIGTPIEGVANKLQKPLDFIEVGLRSLRPQVSGAMVRANAVSRLSTTLLDRWGLDAAETRAIVTALDERVAGASGLFKPFGVRGLSGVDIWKAVAQDANLIPKRLLRGRGRMQPRDLMLAILDAWEGDLRYVGLTQKFTGRMKRIMAQYGPLREFAGGNFAGQFAETYYPTVRFSAHPRFQAQELAEGPILNTMAGVPPFLGGPLSATDQEIARNYQAFKDHHVVSMFDGADQAEFSQIAQIGGRIDQLLEGIPNAGIALSETGGLKSVARQKFVNYLRMWDSLMGTPLRKVLGEDRFLELKGYWGVADDNVVARKFFSEMLSEGMDVAHTPNGFRDYAANIATGEMHYPMALGSLRPLNLDYVARGMGYEHVGGLRKAIEKNADLLDSVIEMLRGDSYNVPDEALNRVVLALKFNVNEFWTNVRSAYHLTDSELGAVRGSFDASARMRGLTPVEYLSGVVAPQITKTAVGDLAKSQAVKDTVALLRAPARATGSQVETLYRELAAAFKPHLDPSGVEVLRKASGIKSKWGPRHNAWLGDQMRAYAEGAVPLNPDVERALQFMGKWTNEAGGLLGSVGSPEFRAIMAKTAKMDTAAGVPYNFTEHLLWNAVVEKVVKAAEDLAHTTHYYKRSRTVLERSANHPFFGIYPASYMWGKILPRMVKFVAFEPFGIRTGALAYASNDVYRSVAMQRELDSEFDKEIEAVGHSPAISMLAYMMPSVPWDNPALLPGYARELADQGFANKQRRDAGLPTKNIDAGAAVTRVADYLSPLHQDAVSANSTLKQVGNVVAGTPSEQAARGGPQVTVPFINAKIGGSGQQTPIETLTPVISDNVQRLTDWLGSGKFE